MLNVSKVDREIKIIPSGWHFEAGEKMIYDYTQSSLEGVVSLKGL